MTRRSTRIALLGALGCVLALAFWWPAFRVLEATGFGDWQMVHHNWEVGYVSAVRDHALPLFDPYHCGGVTLFGNPEAQVYSPLFLLAFVVGTTLATKLFVVLHSAAAFFGAVHHGRTVARLSWPASLLGGVAFAGSGFFAWHLAGGHATFAPFALLPALHTCARRGEHDPRAAILGGLLLALTIAEGGTYPFPYMVLSVGLAAALRIITDLDRTRSVVRSLLVTLCVAVACSLHRLVPITSTLARLPRTIGSSDSSTVADLVPMLTAREHEWGFPGHEFVWPEYGSYVGFGVLALAAVGVARFPRRRVRGVALEHAMLAVLAGLLVLGNASSLHPWPLLRHLPVFDSLRVPSRFLVVLTFHLAMLAGLGLDAIDARRLRGFARHAATVFATLVVVLVAVDLAVVTRPIVDRWEGAAIDATERAGARSFVYARAYDATYASLPRRNEATTLCYVGGMNWRVSPALRIGPVAQAWSDDAEVTVLSQTASRWTVRTRSTHPSVVYFNQNFDPGFRSEIGRVVDRTGLLSIDVPAGDHRFTVAYDPRSALWLVAGSLVASGLCVAAMLRYRGYPMRTKEGIA